jgi:hypothetical protein
MSTRFARLALFASLALAALATPAPTPARSAPPEYETDPPVSQVRLISPAV